MKKLIMITALSCLIGKAVAQEYPIEVTMIKPQMQNEQYQVEIIEEDNFLGTLVCTNGNKVKLYDKKDIYIPQTSFWDAKSLIRWSIVGDIVAKAIESESVFVGNNTSWPIVVGTEVAKEGIIKYSEKNLMKEDNKEKALNLTAGLSTGSSVANLAIVAGVSNPIGAVIGIVGAIVTYNEATKQYELRKKNSGKMKVITLMNHPVKPEKVYVCD